jgi:hypothetical protein
MKLQKKEGKEGITAGGWMDGRKGKLNAQID